ALDVFEELKRQGVLVRCFPEHPLVKDCLRLTVGTPAENDRLLEALRAVLATGVPFLDHMLDQVARHGMLDLEIKAKGDLHIDAHHTVEDIGITLGQAIARAVGDKRGIRRYGHAYVPLDEALSRVVVDFSGRPGLEYRAEFKRALIGEFD